MSGDAEEPEAESPLDWVSTDDLMEELGRRFQHFVFGGIRDYTDEEYNYFRQWNGNAATCSGLCQMISTDVIRGFNDAGRPAPE